MRKLFLLSAVPVLTLALTACNSSSRSSAPEVSAPAASAPSASLPAGAGCSASVSTFKSLIDTDLATGHTTKSVHAQVSQEISGAAQLCSAGNDAGARAAISASRAKHGYPAG